MVNIDSNKFNVNLNAFSGSLDVLLDLAKSQKVNLENISVSKLADQFHEFITKAKDLNLKIASDYLLMATWLTYLKSKLLLPDSDEEELDTGDSSNDDEPDQPAEDSLKTLVSEESEDALDEIPGVEDEEN